MQTIRRAVLSLACIAANSAAADPERRPAPQSFASPVFVTATPAGGEILGAEGVFLSPSGAKLFFCSVNGCYPGRHLAAAALINMDTALDATAQEVGLFVNVTSRSGRAERWKPHTGYARGMQVEAADGVYEAKRAGTSGPASPPAGRGVAVVDGGVLWSFRGETIHNGKTALGAGLNMVPGSGQGWSLVSDLTVQPGVGDQNAFGYENDCANYNKDSDFGVPFLMTCFFQGGQGVGTKPMFSYRYVAAGDGSSYGAHFGDFFNGAVTIKDATFADATNALNTIRVIPGTRHDSVFLDGSTSNRSIDIKGSYGTAIDLAAAQVSEAQVKGRGWQVAPDGTITAAGYRARLDAPRSSTAPCERGDVRFGEDYVYVCVQPSRWKRAALNDW